MFFSLSLSPLFFARSRHMLITNFFLPLGGLGGWIDAGTHRSHVPFITHSPIFLAPFKQAPISPSFHILQQELNLCPRGFAPYRHGVREIPISPRFFYEGAL